MKTSFEIIDCGFSQHILGDRVTGDPVTNAILSLSVNHGIRGKLSSCRLNRWAIFRESGSTLATDIKAYPGGDDRRSTDAFVSELLNLDEPCVLVIFSKGLIKPETLRATYDLRRVSICHPDRVTVVDVTDPESTHYLAKAYQRESRQNAA